MLGLTSCWRRELGSERGHYGSCGAARLIALAEMAIAGGRIPGGWTSGVFVGGIRGGRGLLEEAEASPVDAEHASDLMIMEENPRMLVRPRNLTD